MKTKSKNALLQFLIRFINKYNVALVCGMLIVIQFSTICYILQLAPTIHHLSSYMLHFLNLI